jgi:hypothetical protein
MDIALILSDKYEGRQFSVGDTYESIVALDGGDIPPLKELKALWPEVQHARAVEAVKSARHSAYMQPDGPDAVFMQYQRGDATEQDWLDAVQAVKDAHPYLEA